MAELNAAQWSRELGGLSRSSFKDVWVEFGLRSGKVESLDGCVQSKCLEPPSGCHALLAKMRFNPSTPREHVENTSGAQTAPLSHTRQTPCCHADTETLR